MYPWVCKFFVWVYVFVHVHVCVFVSVCVCVCLVCVIKTYMVTHCPTESWYDRLCPCEKSLDVCPLLELSVLPWNLICDPWYKKCLFAEKSFQLFFQWSMGHWKNIHNHYLLLYHFKYLKSKTGIASQGQATFCGNWHIHCAPFAEYVLFKRCTQHTALVYLNLLFLQFHL